MGAARGAAGSHRACRAHCAPVPARRTCAGARVAGHRLWSGAWQQWTDRTIDLPRCARSTPRGGLDRGRPRRRTRSRCSTGGCDDARRAPSSTSPTRWWSRPSSADCQPSVADGAAQGRRRADGFVFFTNTGSRKGRAGRPTRGARCSSRGTRWSGRCGSTAWPSRWTEAAVAAYFASAAARLPARCLGLAPVAGRRRSRRAGRGVRRGRGALPRGRRAGPRGVGWLPGPRPRRSSSGRAGRAGCTTGWSTGVPTAAGRPSGWRRTGRVAMVRAERAENGL